MSLAQPQLSLFNPEELTPRVHQTNGHATFRTFFRDVYDVAKLSGVKPKSRVKYTETLAHWHAAVGETPLDDVTNGDVMAFYRYLLSLPGRMGADRLSDASVRRHVGRLKSMYKLARKRGVADRRLEFPKHVEDKSKRIVRYWLSAEEIELIIAEPGPCDRKRTPRLAKRLHVGDWWRAIVYVTWFAACRVSESLALEWRHLDGDVLEIPPVVKRSKRSRYKVIDAKCLKLLKRIQPPGAGPTEKIFAGIGPYANLGKHFERLAQWAGITLPGGSRWHSLRRGRCEMEFLAGGPQYAQAALGHGDLATTEESYLRELTIKAASIEQQRQRIAAVNGAEKETRSVSEGNGHDVGQEATS